MAFACNSSGVMTILAGKNDESVVKIISSEDHPICYEEVNGETVDPFKIDADTLEGKSVQDIVKLVPNPDLSGYAKSTEVESLKTSVSEGKKLVAAAVTDKGVNTAADSTFQAIANNIGNILQIDTSDATATENDIANGKSAYVDGKKLIGIAPMLAGSTFTEVKHLVNGGSYQLDVNAIYVLTTVYYYEDGAIVKVDLWSNGKNTRVVNIGGSPAQFAESSVSSTGLAVNGSGHDSVYTCDMVIYKLT